MTADRQTQKSRTLFSSVRLFFVILATMNFTVKQIRVRRDNNPAKQIGFCEIVFLEECLVNCWGENRFGLSNHNPIFSIELGRFEAAPNWALHKLMKEVMARYSADVPSPPLTEDDIKTIKRAIDHGTWDE